MQRHTRHLGPYSVLDEIGSGGMGTIYRAFDTRLEREVALKVLHQNLDVSGARERFVNEARVVSSLNHPNICTIHDIGEQEEDLFLVMELLHGLSLKERIAAGPLSAGEISMVAREVAKALEAAHAKRIVHRDIKPANIFLLSTSQAFPNVKVLDFGLAKYNRAGSKYRNKGITRLGATVGTVEYMSPEQACGQETDERSDLFSLGAVLYEMATGMAPFRGATSAVIYSELLNSDPLPARDANLNLPDELGRIIHRLLEKAPENRIQTASDLLQELKRASLEEEHTGCRPGVSYPKNYRRQPHIHSHVSGKRLVSPRYVSGHNRSKGNSRRRQSIRFALVCMLLLLLVATVRLAWAGRSQPAVFRGILEISPLRNCTGDTALDSAPTALLKHELERSTHFIVRTLPNPLADDAGRAVEGRSSNASTSLLTGSILPVKNGYSIHLEVANQKTGAVIVEAEELAPSLEQVPAAVSRAALNIHEGLDQPPYGRF